jgi:hypothetical protein
LIIAIFGIGLYDSLMSEGSSGSMVQGRRWVLVAGGQGRGFIETAYDIEDLAKKEAQSLKESGSHESFEVVHIYESETIAHIESIRMLIDYLYHHDNSQHSNQLPNKVLEALKAGVKVYTYQVGVDGTTKKLPSVIEYEYSNNTVYTLIRRVYVKEAEGFKAVDFVNAKIGEDGVLRYNDHLEASDEKVKHLFQDIKVNSLY